VRNPLDLPGPDFLVFYVLLALVVLGLLYVARVRGESGEAPRLDTSDPYLIAFLRGGKNEALRVATVALIDRGLLIEDEDKKTVVAAPRRAAPSLPIEQALVRHFEEPHMAPTVFGHPDLTVVCEPYERRLAALGLLPDGARRARRRSLLMGALLVLVGASVAKIAVALSRGRSNVMFLVLLTIVAAALAARVASPRLTASGRAVLADLRRLCARLRARAPQLTRGGGSGEVAMLAAVFGVGALSGSAFGFVRALYPQASSSGTWLSSCGSSCGSSSCGGGCGGGGCGGCGGGGGSD